MPKTLTDQATDRDGASRLERGGRINGLQRGRSQGEVAVRVLERRVP